MYLVAKAFNLDTLVGDFSYSRMMHVGTITVFPIEGHTIKAEGQVESASDYPELAAMLRPYSDQQLIRRRNGFWRFIFSGFRRYSVIVNFLYLPPHLFRMPDMRGKELY